MLLADAQHVKSRGESAASALEANLTSLENKLDDILASLGIEAGDLDEEEEEEEEGTSKKVKGGNVATKQEDSKTESKGKGEETTTATKTTDGEKGKDKKTEG